MVMFMASRHFLEFFGFTSDLDSLRSGLLLSLKKIEVVETKR